MIFPIFFNLSLVLNLFPQLCQVEHFLFETKSTSNSKQINLDSILKFLEEVRRAILEKEFTRNQANMFKRHWFKAYSIHGRK